MVSFWFEVVTLCGVESPYQSPHAGFEIGLGNVHDVVRPYPKRVLKARKGKTQGECPGNEGSLSLCRELCPELCRKGEQV